MWALNLRGYDTSHSTSRGLGPLEGWQLASFTGFNVEKASEGNKHPVTTIKYRMPLSTLSQLSACPFIQLYACPVVSKLRKEAAAQRK